MRTKNRTTPPLLSSVLREDILDSKDPYDALVDNELAAFINEFIKRLPQRERMILTLNFFYGKKHREITQMLKIPANTVSTIIKRTKDLLRKELNKKGL